MIKWIPAPGIDWNMENEMLFIDGIGPTTLHILRERGVETLKDLINMPEEDIVTETMTISAAMITKWKIQAAAVLKRRIQIEAKPKSPRGMIFLDLEMGGRGSFIIWLVGAYDYSANDYQIFLAKRDYSERGMLRKFMEFVESSSAHTITSYSGNNMDYNLLLKRLTEHDIDSSQFKRLQAYDLLKDIKGRMKMKGYFPNYKLKTVGKLFGYTWKHKRDMNGRVVAYIWNNYQKNPDRHIPWRKMIDYNTDDVMSMVHIMKGLKDIWDNGNIEE